jgi:hypothetical protein
MAVQPDITFRSAEPPFDLIQSVTYVTTHYSESLPTLAGDVQGSDKVKFRIYNNWAANSSIANAINCDVTVYDAVGSVAGNSSPASSLWTQVWETMFGESVPSGYNFFTQFDGFPTPVGGADTYTIETGSDGSMDAVIRAGPSGYGVGFVELESYITPPLGVIGKNYLYTIALNYQWTT